MIIFQPYSIILHFKVIQSLDHFYFLSSHLGVLGALHPYRGMIKLLKYVNSSLKWNIKIFQRSGSRFPRDSYDFIKLSPFFWAWRARLLKKNSAINNNATVDEDKIRWIYCLSFFMEFEIRVIYLAKVAGSWIWDCMTRLKPWDISRK
jgi:hypothetical protein